MFYDYLYASINLQANNPLLTGTECYIIYIIKSIIPMAKFCFNSRLWKESLNSDGQQFHHYQQNGQSTVTSSHWTKK
jgi:hypothetical protein